MKRYVILRNSSSAATEGLELPGFEAGILARRRVREGGEVSLSVERLPEKALTELAGDPDVAAVTQTMPIRLIKPLEAGKPAKPGEKANWGIAAVGADTSPFTGDGVTVAVLDTGIEKSHPAFAGVELVEKDFSGSGVGDRDGHGTHCAGTIFGRDCGERIGIARGVRKALIGKVLRDGGGGDSDMIFDALHWAMREGADVISMSLGFDFPGFVDGLVKDDWPIALATSTALEAYRDNLRMFDAVMDVLKAQSAFGISPLVVAASGNESRRGTNKSFRIAASLPAAAEGVIAVAAIGRDGKTYKVADFSNTRAEISAPGVDITSAWIGGGLNTISGTSMACPHVAGVAALWWEALKKGGTQPTARSVSARLLANARKDMFKPDVEELDIGQGFVTAPK